MTVSALSYLHSCHLNMVALMMIGNNKVELMRAHPITLKNIFHSDIGDSPVNVLFQFLNNTGLIKRM